MNSSEAHARPAELDQLVGTIFQDCIQIQHYQRQALRVGIYQTPRVEDKPIVNHQRIHEIDDDRNVALPLYDAQMTSKWTPPSTEDGMRVQDFLVPVRKGTAVSLRVFDVAPDSMYKYKIFAGDVNVARPKWTGGDQDYFVAPAQEWVYGTRFANDPCIVRQFQVLQGDSGFSLPTALFEDDTIKCMEIQISSRKAYEVTGTCDIETSQGQSSETSNLQTAQKSSVEDIMSCLLPDAPGTDVEEIITGDSFQKPETNNLVSTSTKNNPITDGFEVHTGGMEFPPIHAHDTHSHNLVNDSKTRIQDQEGIPINMQTVLLDKGELRDEHSLQAYASDLAATGELTLYSGEIESNSQLEPCILYAHSWPIDLDFLEPSMAEIIDPDEDIMDICPGGLVRQKFTLDEDPKRWNECCEGTLRIHLIDEERFERVTGLKRDAYNNAASQAQRAFVTSGLASRQFVQESEISGGLPSVAQMWEKMKMAKATSRVSPATSSTGSQVQLDIEEPKAKRSKLAKFRFISGK